MFFLFNKIYFYNPENNFLFEQYLEGMIWTFYNIVIFDKYFGVFGSDQDPVRFWLIQDPVRLTIKCLPGIKPLNFFVETE